MTACLIQSSDADVYAHMLDVTAENIGAFCRRHNLAYRSFRGLKRGHWQWHSCFNRIYIFEELIAEGHDGWVLYLDADAFVVDMDFPIGEYLDARNEYAGIVVHAGATPAYWDINNGVMFLNLKTEVAKLIVRDWSRRHQEILEEPEYLSRERPTYFGDQRLLQHVLRDNPLWFDSLLVESQEIMNSMHATFIRHHLRAFTPDFGLRLAAIREEVDDIMKRHSAEQQAVLPNSDCSDIVPG
jgi:hypothetical protein